MAAKPETTFYTSVHRHLPPELYRMKLFNPYVSGPADHWYSGTLADLWVEWKFFRLPKRSSTMVKPDLSPMQQEWTGARLREGRNVAVILGCSDGGVVYEDLSWEKSLTCGEFRARLKTRKQLAEWIEGKVWRGSAA